MSTKDTRIADELEGVLTALRPSPVELDFEWSIQTLETILAETPAPRPARRKRRFVAAGLAVGVIAAGGAAYATGNAPRIVTDSIADLTGSKMATPVMHQVTDLTLPDGSRFAAWTGRADGIECHAAIENWDGKEDTSGTMSSCGEIATKGDPDNDRFRVEWPAGKDALLHTPNTVLSRYQVVYGDVDDERVVKVRATKEDGTEVVMTVDPSTGGFGSVLAGPSRLMPDDPSTGTWVKLEFLNPTGEVLRTERVLG